VIEVNNPTLHFWHFFLINFWLFSCSGHEVRVALVVLIANQSNHIFTWLKQQLSLQSPWKWS